MAATIRVITAAMLLAKTPPILCHVDTIGAKASFEYQVRPQQIVYAAGTTQRLTNPFRTNSAVAGLEWVY